MNARSNDMILAEFEDVLFSVRIDSLAMRQEPGGPRVALVVNACHEDAVASLIEEDCLPLRLEKTEDAAAIGCLVFVKPEVF